MKRIYVTTVPLQGFRDLAKNTYRSAANSGDIETRFPILQVLHNTLQEGDDFHIIAIRSVNGDTQRNFGYLKEELQAMGFTEDHIRELSMPDEQDCSTLIRLWTSPTVPRPSLWCSWRLSPAQQRPMRNWR